MPSSKEVSFLVTSILIKRTIVNSHLLDWQLLNILLFFDEVLPIIEILLLDVIVGIL